MCKPTRRQINLLVEELQTECLLYDSSNNKVHHLNSTLAWVWNHCDGTQTADDMATSMRLELGHENAPELVATGLDQLASANLLEPHSIDAAALKTQRPTVSRRAVMASAATVAPVIVSIIAPTPAAAKSKPDKIKNK